MDSLIKAWKMMLFYSNPTTAIAELTKADTSTQEEQRQM